MGVYTELLSDIDIVAISKGLREEGSRTVVILGCGACTNESLAYSRGHPLTIGIQQDNRDSKEIPYAVTCEMNRVASILATQGLSVTARAINVYGEEFFCNVSDEGAESLKKAIPSGSVILALCCPAGQIGIKRIVGEPTHVLSLVKVVGTLYCHYKDKGEVREIDRERCAMVSFRKSALQP